MQPSGSADSSSGGIGWILGFDQIRAINLPQVGGKGANLGELTAAGLPVPPGFCVTTQAFKHFMALNGAEELYALLDTVEPAALELVRQVGEQVRTRLHQAPIPAAVAAAIGAAWRTMGQEHAYAVRSSATAEDLPDASFAGQQDTYLNIYSELALLESVRNCWASLFTDRAILYRLQNGFDHREVSLAVVVQRMVEPQVAGIMFTADPVTGLRHIVSIDASFGLGEALVAGLVTADLYQVDTQANQIIKRQIGSKHMMIRALPEGGVEHVTLSSAESERPALSDQQVLQVAALGTRIAALYGRPQDIEWALADDDFFILQARPITSLYPLPQPAPGDAALHLYLSFSHLQVMTDPMPELAISMWRMIFPFGRPKGGLENPHMQAAGGRIYIDVSLLLRHPIFKRVFPTILMHADRLVAQAIKQVSARPEFQQSGPAVSSRRIARWLLPVLGRLLANLGWAKLSGMTTLKTRQIYAYTAAAQTRLAAAPTAEARLVIMVDLLHNLFSRLLLTWAPDPLSGQIAQVLLRKLTARFADPSDLIALTRGLQGNVTTDMDLAVGDLADILRQFPAVAEHLSESSGPSHELLASVATVSGGPVFVAAWAEFIERYGMRAPSEIDPSRPRWSENPASLLQMVLGNAQHGVAGAHRIHHRQLMAAGQSAALRLVSAAGQGPLGWIRRPLVQRLVAATRNLTPLREHPKFMLIQLISLFKGAVLDAAAVLVTQQQLQHTAEVWFLTIPELIAALRYPELSFRAQLDERQAAFKRFQKLTPPRVLTSAGEIPLVSQFAGHAPAGALIGSPVSAGIVEGLARVVRDPQTEMLNPGEILVAPFTDPGWTPLFINAAGLVMEVGGLMTHGSVIAREYGLPAVVGVPDATTRIKTGQRIRVHGDAGYVEIISADATSNLA